MRRKEEWQTYWSGVGQGKCSSIGTKHIEAYVAYLTFDESGNTGSSAQQPSDSWHN